MYFLLKVTKIQPDVFLTLCVCFSASSALTTAYSISVIHENCQGKMCRDGGTKKGKWEADAVTKCSLITLHSLFFHPVSSTPPSLAFSLFSTSFLPVTLVSLHRCCCFFFFLSFLGRQGRAVSYHGNSKLATSYLFSGFTENATGRLSERGREMGDLVSRQQAE